MIFVSDQPASSKWWWIGAMRNTRLRQRWKLKTWIATESASITKMPPIGMRRTSVFVITARAAIAPPSPSEPVSPMNTDAGNELNTEEPHAGPDEAGRQQRQVLLALGDERHRRIGERRLRSSRPRARRGRRSG